MVGKLIKFFLLFCFLIAILAVILLQTPPVQERIKQWVETKAEGTLSIGKVDGIIPFWVTLQDVHYHTEDMDATFDQLKVSISPVTLLFGDLSILRLEIEKANIQSHSKAWPSFPLSLHIHSLQIDDLTYNELKNLSVSGMAEFSKDFSLYLSITQPSFPDTVLKLNVEGDFETQSVKVIANVKNPIAKTKTPLVNLWTMGTYEWETQTFTGSAHGHGTSWKLLTDISLSQEKLYLTSIKLEIDGYVATGNLDLDLHTHELEVTGNFLDTPFTLQSHLDWKDIQATTFKLQVDQMQWKDLSIKEISMEGTWQESGLIFQISMKEFVILDPAYEVFPTIYLELSGKASKEKISFEGEVWGLGSSPFTLSGELPLDFTSSPLALEINKTAPFYIHLKGRGSIDPILAFLENASVIARGTIDLDLTIVGTWNNPEIQGYLIYDDGWIESFSTGALFRGIHMEMEGVGRALQIRSLITHDFDRGDLSGTGYILWDPQNGFPFSFHLYTHQYTILALDPFTASVNAEITLSGNIHEMTISGNASIEKAHLAIPNQMPIHVPTVEVCYINPIATPKPEEAVERKEIPIHWDVFVEAPKNFTIDGRGLTSEWRGNLHISGEQNALNYEGKLKLVSGRFKIINRTFELTEGTIFIRGLETKDITLDVKGDYELPTITASILISGALDNTRFSFCSNPPMSTNQIISWIVFNQDINELTPFQACRLASLLVSLSGKYSGPKTFENIKEGLGIDVFSITDCDIDSVDFTFQVGKYISQGTFVGINKSLSGDFDSVIIQTRLYRNFYLEADYGGSLNGLTPNGGKGVFKWYKSY